MNDPRLGAAIRALRRRRGWRQEDLAAAARVSRSLISMAERGRVESTTIRTVRAIAGALDASIVVDIRWRGGALDRLLDERHARVSATLVGILDLHGWLARPEVSYSRYGERGAIDLLAWHPSSGALLVVEVKTRLTSVEEMLRKHDEKVRLAPGLAAERFGWVARATGRLLVLPQSSTNHRHVQAHELLLRAVLPARTGTIRSWIRTPRGPLAGILFVPDSNPGGVRGGRVGPNRVRRVGPASGRAQRPVQVPTREPAGADRRAQRHPG